MLARGSQNPENVVLLIQLLELTDFYVRYHTINLLKLLGENQPKMLQASILESRVGVSRLVDLLDDQRELVRNGARHLHTRARLAAGAGITRRSGTPVTAAICRGPAAAQLADQGQRGHPKDRGL